MEEEIRPNNIEEEEFLLDDITIKEINIRTNYELAKQYLKDTDWVETYKTRHDLGLDILPSESNKWLIINKRAEYLEFLKGL